MYQGNRHYNRIPACKRPMCRYHRFEPTVANLMMQQQFKRLIERSYTTQEYLYLKDLCEHGFHRWNKDGLE